MNVNANKVSWNLDNKLDLARNKVNIDTNLSFFNEKNSPMYNESISPLYSESSKYDNRVVYNSNGDRFHYKDGTLYRNDEEIMKTGGDSYFVREETDRNEYDTYDIDDDGNEAYSIYNKGVINYHTPSGDYSFKIDNENSVIVDCRARIINNTPIIVYLFANELNGYDFVYLRNDKQYYKPNVKYLNKNVLNTTNYYNQALTNKVTSSAPNQNRNNTTSNITNKDVVDTSGYIKFLNPLIQIANPLEGVYCVSFISDHGGKLKPDEIGYMNIVENNGVFYDSFDSSRDEIKQERSESFEQSIVFKAATKHEEVTTSVYKYIKDDKQPEELKKYAEGNYDKFYLSTTSDGFTEYLTDEIVFDPGYMPTATSTVASGSYTVNTSSSVEVVSYSKWQVYSANTFSDSWTMTADVTPTTDGTGKFTSSNLKNAQLDISFTYTPKQKVIEGENKYTQEIVISTENIIERINEALATDPRYANKEFERFEYQTNYSATTSFNSINENGTEIFLPDESYKYVSLNGTVNTRLASVKITKNDDNPSDIYYTVGVLFRTKNKTTNAIDTAPSFYEFKLSMKEWDFLNDKQPNGSVISDLPYYNFTTAQTVNDTAIDYKQLVNYNAALTGTINYQESQEWVATIGRSAFLYWKDAEPITITKTLKQGDTIVPLEWKFEYLLNNTNYLPAYENPTLNPTDLPNLFEGFSGVATVYFKTDAGDGEFKNTYEDTSETSEIAYITPADVNFIKLYTWNYIVLTTQNVLPNIFLDDGTAVTISSITQHGVLPTNCKIALQAKPTSIDKNVFSWSIIGNYNTLGKDRPGVIWDISVDLNSNYYRIIFVVSTSYGSTNDQIKNSTIMSCLYDTAIKDIIYQPGLSTPDSVSSSFNNAHFYNLQGSISECNSENNKFRTMINTCGLVSGLSYGESDFLGTMLTEWNSISEDKYVYFNKNKIGYYSTDGAWYEIEVKEGDGDIDIIFDRYIIVNTNGFWNCYDIERDRPLHYATDFNNRAMPGISVKQYGEEGAFNFALARSGEDSTAFTEFFVSGINNLYEMSQIAITSTQFSPQQYYLIVNGYENFIFCKAPNDYLPQYIEIFYDSTTEASSATYQYSTIIYKSSAVTLKDSRLVGSIAPVKVSADTNYTPNIFTEFIHTFNNKDLVKNGHFAYPIFYSETTPILTYSAAKQISNVDNIFVIQSQFYGIINHKIVSITYDNYTIIGTDAIIDIQGMVYLGYLPTRAYFWSPSDRCIYTFTGDANLDVSLEASKISQIYSTYYNTATESIFVVTNIGIIVISGMQTWKLDVNNVDDIYFTNKGYFIIVSKEDGKYVATKYSYERGLLDSPVKLPIIVESKYVGTGNGQTINCDSIQLTLISDVDEAGSVKFSSSTFTDVGFKSENKTIKIDKGTWDKGNKAVVVNLFPKYQSGQGFKWHIESDFAISSIIQSLSRSDRNTLTQLNG